MSAIQCVDLQRDRKTGAYWERQFCKLAAARGLWFTANQLGRSESASAWSLDGAAWNHYTLPDVVVWSHPGEHHEIKHKKPTRGGEIGLEQYRLDALLSFTTEAQQPVMYTIHRHDLAGGRDVTVNRIEHWFTCDVADLDGVYRKSTGRSWRNGKAVEGVAMCYWPVGLWRPLSGWWFEREIPF